MKIAKWIAMFVVAMVAGSVSAQQPATGLQDLVGAKGRDGEYQLEQRGYTFIRVEKSDDSAYSYWQETENGQCVVVQTTDGRYASIVYAPYSDCQGGDSAPHGGGDSPRDDGFETICGVIVDGQTFRYKCRAVNVTEDGRVVMTNLHYPDMSVRLEWKDTENVVLHFEGMKPQQATYSTSEGETDFFFEDKTYFYYSDEGLARMEVRNFQD